MRDEAGLEPPVEARGITLRFHAPLLLQRHGGVVGEPLHRRHPGRVGLRSLGRPAEREYGNGSIVQHHGHAQGGCDSGEPREVDEHGPATMPCDIGKKRGLELTDELRLHVRKRVERQRFRAASPPARLPGEQAQLVVLDGHQSGGRATSRLDGRKADRTRDAGEAAAGVERRRHLQHPLDRLARIGCLFQRRRNLSPVPIAEHARGDGGEQPHDDDDRARDTAEEPAIGDHEGVEGDARRDREARPDDGTANEGAGDHDQRGDRGRHPDVRLMPVAETRRHQQREVDRQSAQEHAPRMRPQPGGRAHQARTEQQGALVRGGAHCGAPRGAVRLPWSRDRARRRTHRRRIRGRRSRTCPRLRGEENAAGVRRRATRAGSGSTEGAPLRHTGVILCIG